jgi:hypothetical protein
MAIHTFGYGGGKSVVCLLQFLRHWRRLQPEVWAAATAATLDGVLAAMPRAAHNDSALQVRVFTPRVCSAVAHAGNSSSSVRCMTVHQHYG